MKCHQGRSAHPRVLLIAPQVPPYGGIALQARLMQELMEKDGISVTFLPSNLPFPKGLRYLDQLRGLRPFLRSLIFVYQLWRMLGRADIVHIMACSWLYFFVVVCPAVLVSRVRRKQIVLNYRGGQADRFFAWYGLLVRPIFHLAHVVTAPSLFLVNVIRHRIGVPVRIVPNIAALTIFSYRQRTVLKPKLLVTRHLEKLYDIEAVIRAFGEVQKRYADASLWIAGTGDQEKYLRELVAMLGLKNVCFLGYVPQSELPGIYAQCDILMNASHADNFPGSLVEAAVSGLVVISTGVGGIPYIFENGKSALLVDPGDWRGLAAAVLQVLENPDLALRLSREALQQCSQYDWQNVRNLLYPLYGFESHCPSWPEPGPSQVPSLEVQKAGG